MPKYDSDAYWDTPPLFILGAARSGTTVLADCLSLHPDVAYWVEPKYIWSYGKPGEASDSRTAEEANVATKKYIRNRFLAFLKRSGKSLFIEKTPSNVFRLSFINAVFPEARFIHIIRDGRDVSLSAERKWTSRPDRSAIFRRLTRFEIPLKDLPYYIFDAVRDVIGRTVFPSKGFVWGPRFEGIHKFRAQHSVIETCAMQWAKSMTALAKDLKKIEPGRLHTVYYENILDEPKSQILSLLTFAGLDDSVLDKQLALFEKRRQGDYSDIEKEKIKRITPIIEEQMKHWGLL